MNIPDGVTGYVDVGGPLPVGADLTPEQAAGIDPIPEADDDE
jgi:hypothetical protein